MTMWPSLVVGMATALAQATTLSGQTIVGVEVQGYFYADGVMKESEPQFEITYVREGNVITRSLVYDRLQKKAIPDDTKYLVQTQLATHPVGPGEKPQYGAMPVIRAIGQPGTDAIEVLVVTKDFIQSCKSTADYFVISRLKRLK